MSKWFDLFKTGIHTDSKGVKHTITNGDLETIERKFSEMNDDAALCAGHPETNSPAYGWLKKVKKFGNKLKGMAEDVVPEFAEAVNKRMFKKISISLHPDLRIRHVGFLGAMTPAVKGLLNVPVGCFAEEPGDFTIEFSEDELDFSEGWFVQGRIRTIGRIIQSFRDFIVEKFGIESADKVVQQFDIDYLKEDPPPDLVPAEVGIKSFNESTTPERGKEDKPMKENETPATPGTEKPADFAEKVTRLESEVTSLRAKNEALEKGKVEGEVGNFVEKVKAAGKLTPAFAPGITEILVDLKASGQEINFAENVKKPAATVLMEFIESCPVQVPIKEVAPGGAGGEDEANAEFSEANTKPERLALHRKAKALQKKENIPFSEALEKVTKGGK